MMGQMLKWDGYPPNDFNTIAEWYANAISPAMAMFNPMLYDLSIKAIREWQHSINQFFDLFSLPSAPAPKGACDQAAALQRELNRRQEKIERLQAELNEKAGIVRSQEDRLSNLKSELSSKKREVTLKRKKIEMQAQQISDLTKKIRSPQVKPRTRKSAQQKKTISEPLITPPTAP